MLTGGVLTGGVVVGGVLTGGVGLGPVKNTDTVLSVLLAVASSPPLGLNATDDGYRPAATGAPDTGVSAPEV